MTDVFYWGCVDGRIRRRIFLTAAGLGFAFGVILLSELLLEITKPAWLGLLILEVLATCQAPETQWIVFFSVTVFCLGLTIEIHKASIDGIPHPGVASPSSLPVGLSRLGDQDLWTCGLLLLVALEYGVGLLRGYTSVQVLSFVAGLAFGKGLLAWTLRQSGYRYAADSPHASSSTKSAHLASRHDRGLVEFASSPGSQLISLVLLALLAALALWKPTKQGQYHYLGILRWSGIWENPNIYGLLMATGVVIAVGFLLRAGHWHTLNGAEGVRSRTGKVFMSLLLVAAGLCGWGLMKSYSRGAWIGALIGLACLLWTLKWRGSPRLDWLRGQRFSMSVLLVSLLVIAFWEFRHTQRPLARRMFSLGNLNDFSWRNRVTAWHGALQMIAEKPVSGFGWGQAEKAYRREYRATRLVETGAFQLNDYLTLGVSGGVPVMLCFVVIVGLSWRRKPGQGSSHSTVCHSAASVLLVGFWFDGGLFKLPTAAVFWTLLEIGRFDFKSAVQPGNLSIRNSDNRLQKLHSPEDPALTRPAGTTEPSTMLAVAAGIAVMAALGLTVFHIAIPHCAFNQRTVALARLHLVQPTQRVDFDYLATNSIWSGMTLKPLIEHVTLANYNRGLVSWKVDDEHYQRFGLSPLIDPRFDGGMLWRRSLWEHFYPRIRLENNCLAAAKIVVTELGGSVAISSAPPKSQDINTMWRSGDASPSGMEALCVAALRSVGIPARLDGAGQTELWNGNRWVSAGSLNDSLRNEDL